MSTFTSTLLATQSIPDELFVLYSRSLGKRNPTKTLWIDDYIFHQENRTLTPTTASFGFKTPVTTIEIGNELRKFGEKEFVNIFLGHWPDAVLDYQLVLPIFTNPTDADTSSTDSGPSEFNATDSGSLSTIPEEVDKMTSRRPSLLVNGLPSVQEDATSSTTPISAPNSSSRKQAFGTTLSRMRTIPLQYAWNFFHDKHGGDANTYEGRLTVLHEDIITIKAFWEVYNGFPLESLRMKDSVHLFKRGVKPVWEDPRNVRGGAWTFRVPKEKAVEMWREIGAITVGEGFADVIQPKDDLCGLTLSLRFNSHLIQIWNRDGAATATIDGILAVVLANLSPHLLPKEGSYYYKRHSEHVGFAEVVAKAQKEREEEVKKGLEARGLQVEGGVGSGRIVEAEIAEEEVMAMAAEVQREIEEEADATAT